MTKYDIQHKRLQGVMRQERKEVVAGAKSHMKSLSVALKKYLAGSPSERDYALEHHERLKHYLNKL